MQPTKGRWGARSPQIQNIPRWDSLNLEQLLHMDFGELEQRALASIMSLPKDIRFLYLYSNPQPIGKPEMHMTNTLTNAVAITSGFGKFNDKVLDIWGQGCVELYTELAIVAKEVQRWEDGLARALGDDGFPGVFAYEVSEEVGAYLCTKLKKGQGQTCFTGESVTRTVRHFVHKFVRNGLGDAAAVDVLSKLEDLMRPAPEYVYWFRPGTPTCRRIPSVALAIGEVRASSEVWQPAARSWVPSCVSDDTVKARLADGTYQTTSINPEAVE